MIMMALMTECQWKKETVMMAPVTVTEDMINDRQKDDLWTSLKANFTLPPEEDPDKPVIEPLVKAPALKKMADLFRGWMSVSKPADLG